MTTYWIRHDLVNKKTISNTSSWKNTAIPGIFTMAGSSKVTETLRCCAFRRKRGNPPLGLWIKILYLNLPSISRVPFSNFPPPPRKKNYQNTPKNRNWQLENSILLGETPKNTSGIHIFSSGLTAFFVEFLPRCPSRHSSPGFCFYWWILGGTRRCWKWIQFQLSIFPVKKTNNFFRFLFGATCFVQSLKAFFFEYSQFGHWSCLSSSVGTF